MSPDTVDRALMGMRIESARKKEGCFRILTPGAEVMLGTDGILNIRQRIGAERDLLSCKLPPHLAPWRISRRTPFRCELVGNGLALTVQGDSVLVFAPQQHIRLRFEGHFLPRFSQEVRGNRLLLDPLGGCGFYGIPPRPTSGEDLQSASWKLDCHLARWDEFWVSVCPPRALDQEKLYQSISHDGGPSDPYPSDEVITSAAQNCQIFALHSGWENDAPAWAQDPPGSSYDHPKPWETDRHVPADPNEFARVRDRVQSLGMKFVLYLSPLYSNAPDLYAEMERVLTEYHADGLYFDGWIGHRDDFRPGYHLVRNARAILGQRILYLHSSTEPFGTCRVFLPFVYAYADFVLSGEAGRFGLGLEDFLRYTVSQHQISNSVGVWCHYGSWSDEPGYHERVPTKEHIEMALRNRVRLWRQTQAWSKYPRQLARFDREYYGRLAVERERSAKDLSRPCG